MSTSVAPPSGGGGPRVGGAADEFAADVAAAGFELGDISTLSPDEKKLDERLAQGKFS